ncbi:MAG: hypothetical protein J4G01_09185, partial [Dehalococcoidia bacterium]|nr:hypothetical protein [Dehalococcoidia bacterium]
TEGFMERTSVISMSDNGLMDLDRTFPTESEIVSRGHTLKGYLRVLHRRMSVEELDEHPKNCVVCAAYPGHEFQIGS